MTVVTGERIQRLASQLLQTLAAVPLGVKQQVSVSKLTHVVGYMTPERIYQALKNQPFTRGLPDEQLAKLATLTEEVGFQEDEIIFRAGERSAYLYLVLSGSVCVEISTAVYAICVQAIGPGEAFGWSSLLNHLDTVFQVRAREAATAMRLDADRLLAYSREDPVFGFELFRRLSELVAVRMRATESRLAEFCGIASRSQARRLGGYCVPKSAEPSPL